MIDGWHASRRSDNNSRTSCSSRRYSDSISFFGDISKPLFDIAAVVLFQKKDIRQNVNDRDGLWSSMNAFLIYGFSIVDNRDERYSNCALDIIDKEQFWTVDDYFYYWIGYRNVFS